MPIINEVTASALSLRRGVLIALAAGLFAAALVAIGAILTQSFDRTDLRLVGTSLGFSVFSALGGAGARAERARPLLRALGIGTTAVAAVGFALLLAGMWLNHSGSVWRTFGVVAVLALAGSHACLVLTASRPTDSSAIGRLATVSVVTASIDSLLGALAISGAINHVHAGYVRLLAVLVIVMLLTTALPPILRRLQSGAGGRRAGLARRSASVTAGGSHASELLAIAEQLDTLVHRVGEAAPELETQAAQLRLIARRTAREGRLGH